jgi:hypothetical protein
MVFEHIDDAKANMNRAMARLNSIESNFKLKFDVLDQRALKLSSRKEHKDSE